MGYNCAEAVNFACKNWVDLGVKAGVCRCIKDSVKIDMNQFTDILAQKRIIGKSKQQLQHEPVLMGRMSRMNSLPQINNILQQNLNQQKQQQNDFVGKKTKRISSKENLKKNEPLDNWLCCDVCNKWRKIQKSKI